ncbi:galactokinase [Cellulomonas sp. ATA003]|uniref:galactokinase n=1 Tax=Cellulomonas sp. ATA003 TaxID=3073064 RepID=UPI00287305B7|nr:galactokinase [Cellulomonas sp. ATA003]WNB86111.1 galactokinase [Cellulomonas sp. ATA003]
MSRHAATGVTWVDAWEPAAGAERAAAAFRARFDAEPDGVWSAPGRVNLIGEHTDYNGGLCLPIDLPHRTYVALRRTSAAGTPGAADAVVRLASAQEPDAGLWSAPLADTGPGRVDGWPAYAAGVAWALGAAGHTVGGFDAVVDSCVPYGAGLSSSAALECAVAVALDEAFGLGLADDDAGRTRLVAACIRAENEVAGAPTGGMDQSASLRARAGHALLLDTLDQSVRHVPFDLAGSGLALLVIDTKAEHRLADGQYAARRTACEAAARQLGVATLREVRPDGLDDALARIADADLPADVTRRRVRHVVTEIARVETFVALLDAGRVRDVGPVMDASHASLRDDYEVSAPELDVAVDAARAAGALGARMTGGGFGGSAIALVEVGAVDDVAVAVARAFDDAGFHPPAFLVAEASGPASRTA